MIIKRYFCVVVLSSFFTLLSACGSAGTDANKNNVTTDTNLAGIDDSEGDLAAAAELGESTDPVEPIETVNPLQQALATGDVSEITVDTVLLDAALQTIEDNRLLLADSIATILNLDFDGSPRADGASIDGIDWNPTHDAAVLGATFGVNVPVLRTNSVFSTDHEIQDKAIGIIGEQASRYLVLGSNPMRNYRRDSASLNEDMHQFMINSIAWLLQRDSGHTGNFNVVISQMADSFFFPDERAVREWLDEKYPDQVSYNVTDACDGSALSVCLQSAPDLLIISQVASDGDDAIAISSAVEQAMKQGVPVMYLHHDGGITPVGQSLLSLMGVSYEGDNYWRRLSLENFAPADMAGVLPAEITAVKTLLNRFRSASYSFDWSQCDGENCDAVAGLQSEFLDAAEYVRSLLQNHDTNKRNLFAGNTHRLEKLLVLIGDHFRESVSFPMDKVSTDDTQFMRALFADYSVHHYRRYPAAVPELDLGNFSRGDFSHVTPVSKSLTMTSKRNFRAAGVYALPGQAFSVTRTDASDLTVKVFVNTQRSGSTHIWDTDGYSRPRFLQSPRIEIASGETITMSSPYGGPIQLEFDQNDLTVGLTFEHIGLHPYRRSSADDNTFAAQLQAAHYDWAELSTPGFEVHSTLEKMRDSMTDPALDENLPPSEAISVATTRYVHNLPHVLAGFKGPGIDVVAEIHDFASEHNLTVDNLDLVKHMNADQATCGYGCSGNPYDAYWAFSPLGHGDLHELGHGLEKYRLRFNGWETHTMTNMYSYFSKSQFYLETGKEPNCQSLPFEHAYNVLNESFANADPAAYVNANLWEPMGWPEGAAMFIQLMMSAEDNNSLENGWYLLSRLHLLEREFKRATAGDEALWNSQRENLGLSQYSLSEAKALDQNDWLLVMVSLSTGLDHRQYFSVWGLDFSEKAVQQVQSQSYDTMPLNFYVSSASGFCKGEGFDGRKIPLNGSGGIWPLGE